MVNLFSQYFNFFNYIIMEKYRFESKKKNYRLSFFCAYGLAGLFSGKSGGGNENTPPKPNNNGGNPPTPGRGGNTPGNPGGGGSTPPRVVETPPADGTTPPPAPMNPPENVLGAERPRPHPPENSPKVHDTNRTPKVLAQGRGWTKTVDSNSIYLYLSFFLLSLTGLAFVVIQRKRNSENKM